MESSCVDSYRVGLVTIWRSTVVGQGSETQYNHDNHAVA